MSVEKRENGGRSQSKEELNRTGPALFVQQVEKEGPNRLQLTFTRS